MTMPVGLAPKTLEMVCSDCGGRKWTLVRGEYTASCTKCGSRAMRIQPYKEEVE